MTNKLIEEQAIALGKEIFGDLFSPSDDFVKFRTRLIALVMASQPVSEPLGWFIAGDYHGISQVPPAYNGSEGTIPLYTAPPQPQTVKDALEKAAKLAERMPINSDDEANAYRFTDDSKAIAWDIARAIRALIQYKDNQ